LSIYTLRSDIPSLADVEKLVTFTGFERHYVEERLLIERIACNWIEVHLVEQLTNQLRADGQASLDQVEYYQKFLDRTQRRFLSACKTLAQVRKLMGVDAQSRNPTADTAKRTHHQAGKATQPRHQANEAGVEQLVLEVEAKSR
jgi:hypothetical protein